MKRKAIIPLLLGLGIGLATVKLAVDTIRKAQAANKTPATVKVVWAKEDIGAYTAITPEMVEVVETGDSRFAPSEDRFESVEGLIGRVPIKSIAQRTPVLKSMLTPEGTPAGLVGKIPPGFRAVSVKIDEARSVAYQVKPGDWVDVIVVMDVGSGRAGKDTIAEVILQHIQVGAIGHATAPDTQTGGGKVKPAKSATLLVPEEQVPMLHLAATRGTITLALRGGDDLTTAQQYTANLGDVIPGAGPEKPGQAADGKIAAGPSWGQALFGFLASEPNKPAPQKTFDQEPDPHAVVVVRGAVDGTSVPAIEQITFEGADSSKILDVTKGLPTGAVSKMRTGKDSSFRRSGTRVEREIERTSGAEDDPESNDGE